MNKFLFLVSVLATIVAGCSQEEEVITSRDINDAISFEAYTGRTPVSRAAQISEGNYNHDTFYVFATQHEGNISESTLCDGFMSNVKVSRTIKDDGKWSDWSYSPLRYWKRDDDRKISFFAIGPDEPNGKDASGKYNTNIQYEGLSHSEGEKERHNVHYEYKFTVADNVQSQTDLIYATAVNQTHHDPTQTTGRKVELKFKHALASIAFYAKLDQGYGDHVTITIKSVKLKGKFHTKGTLALPITNNGTASWTNKETPESERTFTIGESDFTLTPKTGESDDVATTSRLIYGDNAYVMVIPQEFGETEIPQIEVTYEVKQTAWSDVQNNVATVKFPSSTETLALSQGTAYNVIMTVSLDAITFTTTCEDWGTSTGNNGVNVNDK